MTPADVLMAAANLIDERGWYHRGGLANGTLCAITAMDAATAKDDDGYVGAYNALVDYISTVGIAGIASWNDAQPDGATVIATLRQVAHELRRAEA